MQNRLLRGLYVAKSLQIKLFFETFWTRVIYCFRDVSITLRQYNAQHIYRVNAFFLSCCKDY